MKSVDPAGGRWYRKFYSIKIKVIAFHCNKFLDEKKSLKKTNVNPKWYIGSGGINFGSTNNYDETKIRIQHKRNDFSSGANLGHNVVNPTSPAKSGN